MHSAESAKSVVPAAIHFDAFRLARDRATLSGTFAVSALARLEDLIIGDAGPLAWRVEGGTDEAGRLALTVVVDGSIVLECQRCLGDCPVSVAHRTLMVLARSEAEANALDDASDHEVVVADGLLDPAELVEEELLLWLPFAPVHPDGQCEPHPDLRSSVKS